MLTNFERIFFVRVALQIALIWSCSGYVNKKSDDLDIVALKTIVEQQAAMIATLQSETTALKNEMTALKNTLPRSFQQVAFTVRFSTDDVSHGISLTPGQTLKFDRIATNLGNAYDASTGVFTAPLPGVYVFNLVAMSPDAASSLMLTITKDSVPLDHVYGEGQSDSGDQGSTQFTIHLTAGEKVWVQQSYGDGVRGGDWTVFSGYIITADKPS